MSTRKSIYVNEKQAALLKWQQLRKAFLSGRGSEKSTVAGHYALDAASVLARAKFFLLGLTYNQIQSIFLPPMISAWETRGLREHIHDKKPGHFVIRKRPPDYWATPHQRPKYFENQITFFIGFTLSIISFDRADRARGENYDGGMLVESTLINKSRYGRRSNR